MTDRIAPRHRRRSLLSLLLATVLIGATPTTVHAAPSLQPNDVNAAFASAAARYDVPRDLLVALGYSESRLDQHDGLPSVANGFGMMHLASNPTNRSLDEAAALTGLSVAQLQTRPEANIHGAAAVLRSYADQLGLSAADRDRTGAWYPVVARYAHASSDETARLYADYVYQLLQRGFTARTSTGQRVTVVPQRVPPELGRYATVRPSGPATPTGGPIGVAALPEYGNRWIAAHPANYRAGRTSRITTVVIHVTQGSYAGTISWFQNPASQVSAHYVVRSHDGEITQMVREGDTAYHARSANPYSIGIEHEGYVDNPAWFTDAMYRSSAALTRYLCDKYGLPKNRHTIKGHNELPGNDHTDPGPHWDWHYYLDLVNGGPTLPPGGRYLAGSPTDFDGDGRDDIVAFTLGELNDVYVALSDGTRFVGTAVKWHDFFGLPGETVLTGDFNGDGRDDIVAFTHGDLADVYVALSTGNGFGPSQKWHDWFAPGAEVAAVGDINGDGRDDIITFTQAGQESPVYVALSDGTRFVGTAVKWHDHFSIPGEYPAVADVNGDGLADIISFTQGTFGHNRVWVALSDGTRFGPAQVWHDWFARPGEQPRVGDINGDGRADIVTFTCDQDADVYAAVSTGTSFVGTADKWHDWFCLPGEFPYVGDFNGDGRDDIVVFTKGTTNDVYVALSDGTRFMPSTRWHDYFGLPQETTL